MATHSSIFAWKIPWTVEPGGLQFIGLQRVGHDRALTISSQYINCTTGKLEVKASVKTNTHKIPPCIVL